MKKWKILSSALPKTSQEIVDVLLKNRGIKSKREKESFLNPKLEDVTIESVGIDKREVKKTIDRINLAIKKNETIVIYGDYDVDGICGVAILWETLFASYKNVMPYIPHRVDEGYGLSIKGIENILEKYNIGLISPPPASHLPDMLRKSKQAGARALRAGHPSPARRGGLIITVDNGIVANDAVEFANNNGIDVIITDHHVASVDAPKAHAIVHTTRLCGAGVAYLLSQQIKDQRSKIKDQQDASHLELVALATIADLVPLTDANRTLVKFGLKALQNTKRPGLRALYAEAKIKSEEIDVYKVGHIIAPRINAAGRIAHGLDSLRLICTKDPARAQKIAALLSSTNQARRDKTSESTLHADSILKITDQKIIYAASEVYEQGIIGLVASRLVEKHWRPSIVVSVGEEISKGSARSITGFNIIEFLRSFDEHFINAGGHPMAAGFTIQTTKLEAFGIALAERSVSAFSDDLLDRILNIDMKIGFEQLTLELWDSIQKLGPFGMGNSEPLFVTKNVEIVAARTVGRDGMHLKLQLSQNEKTLYGIFFNAGEGLNAGDIVDIVYSIEKDSWNGNNKVQLKVKDVRNPN